VQNGIHFGMDDHLVLQVAVIVPVIGIGDAAREAVEAHSGHRLVGPHDHRADLAVRVARPT
jgi:hypothetical protein